MSLLTGNPGMTVTPALPVIGGLLSTAVAIAMARQGLSVRPMPVCEGKGSFAMIFGLIVLPQFSRHLHVALQKVSAPPGKAESETWWTSVTNAPNTPETTMRYFGSDATDATDATDAMISDVPRMFDPSSVKPRWARFAILADGCTTTIAAFNDDEEAEAAVLDYLALSGLAGTASGNTDTGFTATRVTGEEIFVHRAGRHLRVWTGPDRQALNRNVLSSKFYHATRGLSAE